MSESTNQPPADEPKADETFTWTNEPASTPDEKRSAGSAAASLLESVREAVDELAERAAPTVRELSARAAELTAIAADRAAPLAKRAGEVTADASGKLASKSREWASEVRASRTSTDTPPSPPDDVPPGDPTGSGPTGPS